MAFVTPGVQMWQKLSQSKFWCNVVHFKSFFNYWYRGLFPLFSGFHSQGKCTAKLQEHDIILKWHWTDLSVHRCDLSV